MLHINDITYSYEQNNTHTHYHFNCHVAKGEIVGIIGQSGSGKSTFLDLIAGFLEPKSGTIVFEEEDISTQDAQKRPLTILFQKYNTFEHLSVIQNVLLGITTSLKPKKDEILKAKAILKEVELEGYENTPATSLSGGQSQRVALARSLIREKPILLLDEPFNGLDLETRIKMLDLVKNIVKTRALYTIMITHDLQDCKRIADRVYKVEKGQLIPFSY